MKTIINYEDWAREQLTEFDEIHKVECDCEGACHHCGQDYEDCNGWGECEDSGFEAFNYPIEDYDHPDIQILVSDYKEQLARDLILYARALNIDIERVEKETGIFTQKNEEGVPLRAH